MTDSTLGTIVVLVAVLVVAGAIALGVQHLIAGIHLALPTPR